MGGEDAGAASVRGAEPGGKGTGAAIFGLMTGLSRAQVTRSDHRLCAERAGEGGGLSADGSSPRATRQRDVELLAYVDKAHGEPERTGDETDPGARVQRIRPGRVRAAGGDLGGAALPIAQLGAYRKRNTSYQPTRPTPIPIGERRKPRPQGRPGYLRIDTVHQGDRDGVKGLYHINAVDEVTQWEIVAATPQISELWLIPVLEDLLEQFPFVIRGFHSDNGSEFINYTVGQAAGQAAHRTDQIARASLRRQRAGGSQERSGHSQAHRLRPHRCATRRGRRSVPSAASESLRQLSPSLRRAQDHSGAQRQAPPRLFALGHPIRDLQKTARLRLLSPQRCYPRGTRTNRQTPVRYRSCHRNATCQTATLVAYRQARRVSAGLCVLSRGRGLKRRPLPLHPYPAQTTCPMLPYFTSKRRLPSFPTTSVVQAHPSMRIC